MAISSTNSRNNYVGNGATSVYSYNYYIIEETDLLVTIADLLGNEKTLVLGVDYTVAGVGLATGGAITLIGSGSWLTAGKLTTGYLITVRRVRALVQETDIRNQGSYLPSVIEDTFDQACMSDQQQQDEIDRSLKAPETDTPVPLYLPTVAARANKILGFDGAGLPIPAEGVVGVPVTSFMADFLSKATAALGRAKLLIDGSSKVLQTGDYSDGSVTEVKLNKTYLTKWNWNVVSKADAYTAAGYDFILLDTRGGTFAVALPAPSVSNAGLAIRLKWTAGTLAPTITGTGPELTYTLRDLYNAVEFVNDGTNWYAS